MSICNTCHEAKPIPECVTNLQLGTVELSTQYNVYARHVGTQRVQFIQAPTSDGSGILIVDLSGFEKQVNQTYEFYVNKPPDNEGFKKENITVDGEAKDCINIRFIAVNESGALKAFTDQVVST